MPDNPQTIQINGYDVTIGDLPEDLQQIAAEVGLETVLKLVALRDGETLYLPKAESITRAARNRVIAEQFNGSNYCELARAHGLTVRWVRAIVSCTQPRPDVDKQLQMALFKDI